MLHNQSILGFSLLVLSCASPNLGDVVTSSASSLDPISPPPSPSLGTTTGHAFKDINPPQVHPTSTAPSSATDLATMIMSSSSPIAAGINPPVIPTPLATVSEPSASTRTFVNDLHHPSKYRAKLHSSIAAHFSSQLQQAHTTSSSSSNSPQPTNLVNAQLLQTSTATSSSAPIASASSSSPAVSSLGSATSLSSGSTSTSSMGTSATLAISSHSFSAAVISTTSAHAVPTTHDLDDPTPDVHSVSEASQRARRSALLAALLILGTLGALGGGILCFRCGVLPCCHNRRRRRGPASTERAAEEGLRGLARALSEKDGSLFPGKPPIARGPVVLPILPRNLHAHTLSCSTCPPDSINGVRGGVSGTGMGSAADIQVYETNEDATFEDVTHILSSAAFSSDKRISGASTCTNLRSPRDSGTSRATRASISSGSDAVRLSTATTVSVSASVHTRTSRVSEGAVSLAAESYTTCESRYSTPSIDRDERDGPPSPIVEESEDEYYSPASRSAASSPQSSTSTASGASVSVLLMTPEQNDYTGLADAALPIVKVIAPDASLASHCGAGSGRPSVDCDRDGAASPTGSDMDIDCDGSDWDVAHAYGAPPAIPLPPTPDDLASGRKKGMQSAKGSGVKPVKGRPQTGVGLGGKTRSGAVALGGRKVVFMHG